MQARPLVRRAFLLLFVTAAWLAMARAAIAISGGTVVADVLVDRQADTALRRLAADVAPLTVALQLPGAGGQGDDGLCTGVVVHPTVVLTAAHCVTEGASRTARVVAWFTTDLRASGADRRQSLDVIVHPEFAKFLRGASQAATNRKALSDLLRRRGSFSATDVALVLLHRAIPDTHRPAAIIAPGYRDSGRQTKIIAGVGQTDGYQPQSAGRLVFAEIGTLLETRGRDPDDTRRLEARHRGGQPVATCRGDSGGPVFVRDATGRLALVGVSSAGDAHCREFSVFASIDEARAALRRMFQSLTAGTAAEHENPF